LRRRSDEDGVPSLTASVCVRRERQATTWRYRLGPVERTVRSMLLALLGVTLWLLWIHEHEHAGVRAPWTGITLVMSALAFVAAGFFGRRWRSCFVAAVAASVGPWFGFSAHRPLRATPRAAIPAASRRRRSRLSRR
jgi:thiol:disulfide interchange protein